jgi:hypothetical protein
MNTVLRLFLDGLGQHKDVNSVLTRVLVHDQHSYPAYMYICRQSEGEEMNLSKGDQDLRRPGVRVCIIHPLY